MESVGQASVVMVSAVCYMRVYRGDWSRLGSLVSHIGQSERQMGQKQEYMPARKEDEYGKWT
jgi:hypothetical protein